MDDVKLVVVGPDDEYLGKLEALTKDLRMEDKVLITGPLYGEDELEAYACGKPVIASKIGGFAKI